MRSRGQRAKAAVLGVLLGAFLIVTNGADARDAMPQSPDPLQRSFDLINQHNEHVSDQDFRGQWLLVYFGFTQCPDACPISMSELAQAVQLLGPEANRLRVAFITIDPEHDRPEVLSRYLVNFSKSFIGLTGSKAQIAQVLATFDAYAAAGPNPNKPTYSIDHSSAFYLIDPSGHFQRRLSSQMRGDALAATLKKIMKR